MALQKRGLGKNVLQATRERIAWLFDTFPKIYLSFSGGKDSTLLLHLVVEEAKRRDRKIGLLFIDWEAQFKLTIAHVEYCLHLYADHLDVYWVALPLLTTNACSMFEPEWICWQPEKRDLWVREAPERAITDERYFPFYHHAMTFEEFVPAFGHWYAEGMLCASLVGIRASESLNRQRTIWQRADRRTFDDKPWTTWMDRGVFNCYPLYDWSVEDVWTYHARTGKPYNTLYDRMHQAGLTLSQMRICEPYGDEQRRGLWLYHVIEPETWGKVVHRVAGANTGARYGNERNIMLGNGNLVKPDNLTWQQYANALLDSMPPTTADHYRDKIAVWLRWYQVNGIPVLDERENDTGSKDCGSWRRVVKMLLKNDYWCKTLCFSATKSAAQDRYKKIMKVRRKLWGIFH